MGHLGPKRPFCMSDVAHQYPCLLGTNLSSCWSHMRLALDREQPRLANFSLAVVNHSNCRWWNAQEASSTVGSHKTSTRTHISSGPTNRFCDRCLKRKTSSQCSDIRNSSIWSTSSLLYNQPPYWVPERFEESCSHPQQVKRVSFDPQNYHKAPPEKLKPHPPGEVSLKIWRWVQTEWVRF